MGVIDARRFRRRAVLALVVSLALGGSAALAADVALAFKARVARLCIAAAFARHLADGKRHAPWAWADTAPVASLTFGRLGERVLVLEGATGASLAFGAGHVDGTARPGSRGTSVVAGHRDTVFTFLEGVRVGDVVEVRTSAGVARHVVRGARVTTATDPEVFAETFGSTIRLVTCHPIRGVAPTDRRLVVELVGDPPRRRSS